MKRGICFVALYGEFQIAESYKFEPDSSPRVPII